MKKEATAEASTVEEAIDAALEELGVQQDAVEYEVLQEGGKRLLGLGADKQAKVRVWVKESFIAELESVDAEEDETQPVLAREETELPTEEELDKLADSAAAALKKVLACFEIQAEIEEYEGDEGEIILDIVGGELGVLIGRHGRTLDALQTVIGSIASKETGVRHPVLVDVEGYRQRRKEKLEEIGRRAADRAARQRMSVRLRPMTPYERRVVHMALRSDSRVTTTSEGEEPFRTLVVKPN